MQKIQLYIEGQRVDMFEDESITITQTIQNVRDISKIFTDFSRTFNLPASKLNNKIFKHYYNFDILNGFDARKRKDANIEINNLPFRDGKIKLEGVDLKNNTPHTYKVTFFGSTVSLKDLLGDDDLSSLSSLTSLNKPYSATDIRFSLQANPLTNDLIVPLITHTQRLFYDSTSGNNHAQEGNLYYHSGGELHNHGVIYNQLKYAIRLDRIIKAIQTKYNITFSDNFFNSNNKPYYDLFLWLHRKKGDVENLTGVNQSIVTGWQGTIGQPSPTDTEMINSSTLRVFGDPNDYISYSLTLSAGNSTPFKVSIQRDGLEIYNSGTVNTNVIIDASDFSLLNGDYTVYIESNVNIPFTSIKWDITYNSPLLLVPVSETYDTQSYLYVSIFDFDITQQIPEMKVIDFLTGVFKVFNLTSYIDKNSGIVIVKTLDEFYNDGNSYDISNYIEVDKSSVDIALPYREISFEHEDTKTFLAAIHKQKFGKEWGKSEYTNGEKLDGDTYSVKTPFSQMKYERLFDKNGGASTSIQVGFFVDDNQESYFGKPLIFYPIRQTSQTTISFMTSETAHQPITSYNIPSNSLSLNSATSKDNINFFNENNEYALNATFTDTLFEKYYKNYISSVFNQKNRITKVSAYLPLRILLNYTLADRFIINGSSYKINSITTNFQDGKSTIELLNDL